MVDADQCAGGLRVQASLSIGAVEKVGAAYATDPDLGRLAGWRGKIFNMLRQGRLIGMLGAEQDLLGIRCRRTGQVVIKIRQILRRTQLRE